MRQAEIIAQETGEMVDFESEAKVKLIEIRTAAYGSE